MRGGDHYTAVEIVRAHHVGNARCRRDVEQIRVRSRGGKPRGERVFKHIRAAARVLANDYLTAVILAVIIADETSYLVGVLDCKPDVRLAAETVCAEIFCHNKASFHKLHTFIL